MRKSKEKNRSPQDSGRISFEKKIKRRRSPSNFNLKLSNCLERIVIPRAKDSNIHNKLYKTNIKSLNVSRHLIEEEDPRPVNLQFSRKAKLHRVHGRTQSNQVCADDYEDAQMSNFSNSLENISQQLIEIPFANTKITPNNKDSIKNNQHSKGIEFSRKNRSRQKKKTQKIRNGSADLIKNRRNDWIQKENKSKLHLRSSQREAVSIVPKSRKNTLEKEQKLQISQFSLRALRITQNGSILYFAIHKKTRSIYAIKSIRKVAIRDRAEQLLLQLKIGLSFGHPNYTKIYGFFSDKDNFYIIRQYLQQGCILDGKKNSNESLIAQSLNHMLFAASCLSARLDMKYWAIQPSKIAKTHGIAKLTSLRFSLHDIIDTSEVIRQTIEWFFESEDRRSTFEGGNESTLYSKSNHYSIFNRQSYSFLELLDKMFTINSAALLMLLDHPYLKGSRFKATMQE